ncbi:MAG: HAD family hydrolase [Solirubrobacteraceae bacterium]
MPHDGLLPHDGALLIDALGTLVSLAPPAPALREQLQRRCATRVSAVQADAALRAEIACYRAHMALGRDRDSLEGLHRRCAQALREALPPAARDSLRDVDVLTDVLLASLRFEVHPDARPALLRARRAGLRVVAVSNWDVSLAEVLERVGLAPLLDAVVTSAAVGASKPSPVIFRHALALAGVAPERALHVGDSLADDVAGAVGCGIAATLVCRYGAPPPEVPAGVRTIDTLAVL